MLIQGDAAAIPLPDKSVHAVVTSPPYWGLRKYAGEQGRGMFPNLGLEPTPELYIQHIVEIFREVWRVLRDDGTVWLNMGDSFSGSGGPGSQKDNKSVIGFREHFEKYENPNKKVGNLAGGNLMMMPHRVAIALQAAGWIVRNDVVWWKRNPMPESVAGWRFESKPCDCTNERREVLIAAMPEGIPRHRAANIKPGNIKALPDCPKCHGTGKVGDPILRKGSWRNTRAHEYIFQLVKKMNYYSNQEAVREGIAESSLARIDQVAFHEQTGGTKDYGPDSNRSIRKTLENWAESRKGRNPRSVLDVPTQPYKGSHYATFPVNLIAPLIRASCPKRCCPECGAPYAPVVEKQGGTPSTGMGSKGDGREAAGLRTSERMGHGAGWREKTESLSQVVDYRPTCSCECDDHIPGICLDPFLGSGTTGAVARELGRRWVGLDISMEYLDQQAKIRALNWTPSNALDNLPLFSLED